MMPAPITASWALSQETTFSPRPARFAAQRRVAEGSIADQRHDLGPLGHQMARDQGRGGGSAQGREDGHFRHQHRIAGCHIRQHAKGGHGLQAVAGVLGMAVHIFEAIGDAIRGRHEFDHSVARMRGDAGGLVKQRPAPEILGYHVGKVGQKPFHPDVANKVHHVLDADERYCVQSMGLGGNGLSL
jgi:hypothetical protein